MVDNKANAEEGFKSALHDTITILEKLAPIFTTFDDLIGGLKLALENDGQIRLLMKTVAETKR